MRGEKIGFFGEGVLQQFCPMKDSCKLLEEVLRERDKVCSENEQLRRVFEIAIVEFEKRNSKILHLEATETCQEYCVSG